VNIENPGGGLNFSKMSELARAAALQSNKPLGGRLATT